MPLYKGKGDKCECSNSRGISLLSVAGKLYGRVLIKRVRAGPECAIREEQCGFRQGRRDMDQVFAERQVCDKYLENGKDVFLAFIIIIYHDFLPTPRRGSHVKSGKTHTQSSRYTS